MILFTLVDLLFTLYFFALLARVFLPVLGLSPYDPVYQFIYRITEPVLAPIRNVLPSTGAVDFSPLVASILLIIVQRIVRMLLASLLF